MLKSKAMEQTIFIFALLLSICGRLSSEFACPSKLVCACEASELCSIQIPFNFSSIPPSQRIDVGEHLSCNHQNSRVTPNITRNVFDVTITDPNCRVDENKVYELYCSFNKTYLGDSTPSSICGQRRFWATLLALHIPTISVQILNYDKFIFIVDLLPDPVDLVKFSYSLEWNHFRKSGLCPFKVTKKTTTNEKRTTTTTRRRGTAILDQYGTNDNCAYPPLSTSDSLRYRLVVESTYRNEKLYGDYLSIVPSKHVTPANVTGLKNTAINSTTRRFAWLKNLHLNVFKDIDHFYEATLRSTCDERRWGHLPHLPGDSTEMEETLIISHLLPGTKYELTVCDVAKESGLKSVKCSFNVFTTEESAPSVAPEYLGYRIVRYPDHLVEFNVTILDPPVCGRNGRLTRYRYIIDGEINNETSRSCGGEKRCLKHLVVDGSKSISISVASRNSVGFSPMSPSYEVVAPSMNSNDDDDDDDEIDLRVSVSNGSYVAKTVSYGSNPKRISSCLSKNVIIISARNKSTDAEVEIFDPANPLKYDDKDKSVGFLRHWGYSCESNKADKGKIILRRKFHWRKDDCVYKIDNSPPNNPPSAVIDFEIAAHDSRSLTLTLKNPACHQRGAGIDEFIIEYQPYQNGTFSASATSSVNITTPTVKPWKPKIEYRLEYLKQETLYRVRVAARNRLHGDGPWSAYQEATTPSAIDRTTVVAGVIVCVGLFVALVVGVTFARCYVLRRNLNRRRENDFIKDMELMIPVDVDEELHRGPRNNDGLVNHNDDDDDSVASNKKLDSNSDGDDTSGIGSSKRSNNSTSNCSSTNSSSEESQTLPTQTSYVRSAENEEPEVAPYQGS